MSELLDPLRASSEMIALTISDAGAGELRSTSEIREAVKAVALQMLRPLKVRIKELEHATGGEDFYRR